MTKCPFCLFCDYCHTNSILYEIVRMSNFRLLCDAADVHHALHRGDIAEHSQ